MGPEPVLEQTLNSCKNLQPKYDLVPDLDPQLTPPPPPESAYGDDIDWTKSSSVDLIIKVKTYNPNMLIWS